jgi:hypothetical protein
VPVKVLSRLFRGKFVAYLKAVNEQGRAGLSWPIETSGRRRSLCEFVE